MPIGDFRKGYLSVIRRPTKVNSSGVGYFFWEYIALATVVMKSLMDLVVINLFLMPASTSGEKLLGKLNNLQKSSHAKSDKLAKNGQNVDEKDMPRRLPLKTQPARQRRRKRRKRRRKRR